MAYVIKRHGDGAYVSVNPELTGGSSYTHDLFKAKVFLTHEQAKRECCGNESVIDRNTILATLPRPQMCW